jgi:hypothetical protein
MVPSTALPVRVLPATAQATSVQPTKWKAPAQLASGVNLPGPPAKVRGVSADVPPKFVLPSPEALGVSVNLNLPPADAPKARVDWNQIQSRLERLGVLRYEKERIPAGGVRISMLLPTGDPTRGQPVEARAQTEAAAIVMALDAAEAWMRKR